MKLIIICLFIAAVKSDREYFWRPWTPGSPPADAITGLDYRGLTYIVEGYAPKYGLFIGQAFANQQHVNVSAVHFNTSLITQATHGLKVLCSDNSKKLGWYPSNSKNLGNEIVSASINPVVGGLSVNDEVLYIGRYVDTSLATVHFGSICTSFSQLHYHYNTKNLLQTYFEILVIDKKCTD